MTTNKIRLEEIERFKRDKQFLRSAKISYGFSGYRNQQRVHRFRRRTYAPADTFGYFSKCIDARVAQCLFSLSTRSR